MQKIITSIVFLVLLVCPFFIWGNHYLVGGDDSKLYYVFPQEYIDNFAARLSHNNTLSGAQTGYVPVAYFIPLFLVIKYLKFIPWINVQMLLYGLNLSFGFLFCFFFLRKINIKPSWAASLGSLVYIFSELLFRTLYNHQLPAMYLVSVMPGCLWLFTKSILDKKIIYSILSVVLFSVFSTTLNTMPWWSAFILTSIPFLIWLFVSSPKRFAISTVVVIISGIILNSYWIVPYIDSLYSGRSNTLIGNYAGGDYKNENRRIANGVVGIYTPFDVMSQLGIFLLPITLIVLTRKKNIGSLFALSIILAWYFYSPNFSETGKDFFIYLVEHVPFWGMYRNMFDKFALGLAFWYAVGIAFAIQEVKVVSVIALLGVYLCLYSNVPKLKSRVESKTIFSGQFNQDYMDLITFFKKIPNSKRIVWFPLNFPAYASIRDSIGNWYLGPSPLLELAQKGDVTGQFSFLVPGEIEWGRRIFGDLTKNKYDSYSQAVSYLDVGYAVVNKDIPDGTMAEFFYGGVKKPYLDFKPLYLGKKLASFGNKYDVYEFNPPQKPGNIISIPYSNRWKASVSIKPAFPLGIEINGDVTKADLRFELPTVVKLFSFWSK